MNIKTTAKRRRFLKYGLNKFEMTRNILSGTEKQYNHCDDRRSRLIGAHIRVEKAPSHFGRRTGAYASPVR